MLWPDNYFQVYDKTNLNLIYQLDKTTGPAYTTEDCSCQRYSLHCIKQRVLLSKLCWQNWQSVLTAQTYTNEIRSTGANGLNPDYLTYDNNTHKVITLNNLDFTNASVSTYDNNTGAATTTKLNVGSGCVLLLFMPRQGAIFLSRYRAKAI